MTMRARSADELPGLDEALQIVVTSSIVRQYVRAAMVEPCLRRLFDVGMGVEKFDTPTMMGNVVRVEAPPSIQVKALLGIVQAGVPNQTGLTDNDATDLPGVFALGPLGLDEARRSVHGERYIPLAGGPYDPNAPPLAETSGEVVPATGDPLAAPPPPMEERIAAGEFEVVEIEEDAGMPSPADDQSPGPVPPRLTLEQLILAKRRARRMNGNGNGNGNGKTNGNGNGGPP